MPAAHRGPRQTSLGRPSQHRAVVAEEVDAEDAEEGEAEEQEDHHWADASQAVCQP